MKLLILKVNDRVKYKIQKDGVSIKGAKAFIETDRWIEDAEFYESELKKKHWKSRL